MAMNDINLAYQNAGQICHESIGDSETIDIQPRCDWCGARKKKFWRRYKGELYCINCYKQWFIKKSCHRCGEIARLHKKEDYAICQECRRQEPCIRCGGNAYKNGANTQYGRVCQVCYQGYFATPKPCEVCGNDSRKLSTYQNLNHNLKVCPNCYDRRTKGICESCRRHRKLTQTKSGNLCKKCLEFGEIPCPHCGDIMPAGRGDKCESCYWMTRLQHEIALNLHMLESVIIRTAYNEFVTWFAKEKGRKKAVLKHKIYLDFFVNCDELWGRIPSYAALVQEFKPNGLRHYLTVIRWLTASGGIIINKDEKKLIAEQERISNLLAKFTVLPTFIKLYHAMLIERREKRKTKLQTLRSALQPVVDIYLMFNLKGDETPNQSQIDTYMLAKSGQYSCFYGFVRFLNDEHDMNLICEKPDKLKVNTHNKRQLEQAIMLFLKSPNPLGKKDKLRWYQLALAYFHETYVDTNKLDSIEVIGINDKLVYIKFKNNKYPIPCISTAVIE